MIPLQHIPVSILVMTVLLTTGESRAAQFEFDIENSNIVTYVEEFSDFNRLRLETTVETAQLEGLQGKLIVDNVTSYIQPGQVVDNEVEIYRAILEYQRNSYSIYAGRQRVPLGVGRIWNPIDIFNPIDITSIEPEEREGTDSLRLEYYPTDLSALDVTISEEKMALRMKGYVNEVDVALVGLHDEDRTILGWELEGELLQSGVEIRSEGGLFYDRGEELLRAETIVGLEYGFPNSITLLAEVYINQENLGESIALQVSSQISPLLSVSLLAIRNMDDNSSLLLPAIQCSLSDEMSLDLGLFLYSGSVGDTYGGEETFFLNWFIQF